MIVCGMNYKKIAHYNKTEERNCFYSLHNIINGFEWNNL